MRERQFALRVAGIDVADDAHLDALGSSPEVRLVSRIDDVTVISLAVVAPSDEAAVRAGVHLVEEAVPGSVVESIDLDLVAATDVAERAGVTRQSVSQWVTAGRRGKAFPTPLGILAGGTRVWTWAAVLPWLQSTGSDLEGEATLSVEAITEVNALLRRPRPRGSILVRGGAERPDVPAAPASRGTGAAKKASSARRSGSPPKRAATSRTSKRVAKR